MNKNYVSPSVEIKSFIAENVITASGTTNLTAVASKTFTNADANAKWGDQVK